MWPDARRRLGSVLTGPRTRAGHLRPEGWKPVAPLHAEVHGEGPLHIVLLHGQPGSGADWQRVVPRLGTGFTVLVPDRPGYGSTGGPATDFAGNARAVIDLMDRLGASRAVVGAHSWAGGVALTAASRFPARVADLVLVGSVGPGERMGWSDRLLAAPVVGEALAATALGGMGLVLGSRRVQRLAPRLPERVLEEMGALTRLTAAGSAVWRAFVAEQRAMLEQLDSLGPSLGTITAPTVVLHGRGDRLVAPAVAKGLARAIPGAELRLLPGAGHLLPHDHPGAVAQAIVDVAGRQPQG